MYKPNQKLKDLYEKMSILTKTQCEKDCLKIRGTLGGCCGEEYCDMAIDLAAEAGEGLLIETRGSNGCLVPPWIRPICTMHICERSLMDKEFCEKYFELRDEIEMYQFELFEKDKK